MEQTERSVAVAKAGLFKALAHPVRLRVLELLVGGERSVGDLAGEIGVEVSHLSQQLAILRRTHVVEARRERTTVYYSLRDPRMAQLLAVAKQMLLTGLRDDQAMLSHLEQEVVVKRPSVKKMRT